MYVPMHVESLTPWKRYFPGCTSVEDEFDPDKDDSFPYNYGFNVGPASNTLFKSSIWQRVVSQVSVEYFHWHPSFFRYQAFFLWKQEQTNTER